MHNGRDPLVSVLVDTDFISIEKINNVVGAQRPLKNCRSHIDASHSRQPLVKGERLVRYEVNAVMA